jgi:hypothetical protein
MCPGGLQYHLRNAVAKLEAGYWTLPLANGRAVARCGVRRIWGKRCHVSLSISYRTA